MGIDPEMLYVVKWISLGSVFVVALGMGWLAGWLVKHDPEMDAAAIGIIRALVVAGGLAFGLVTWGMIYTP